MRLLAALLWVYVGLIGSAWAASPVEEAQMAELERVRAEVGGEVQLAAYDLFDELAYGWTQEPVFEAPTPVVLAGVTVPVGLGTGMQALLENHIAAVLGENPTTNIQLVHCPSCTAVVVHSGPEGTVVTRGIDNPKVLEEVGGATGKHALFIDVEAEGAWLVLRARITRLTPELPIVWSHTVTTSAGSPALLREATDLKSAAEARKEYLDALRNRGPVLIPLRLAIHAYARPRNRSGGTPPPPLIWLQSGVELGATDGRAWTSSLMVGYSFIPQAYQGIMGEARVSRLLTGRARSLTHPDLYGFVGAAVMSVWGPATGSFQVEPLTVDDILLAQELEPKGPRQAFGGLQVGVDLRLGNRMGISTFLERLPSLGRSKNIGDHTRILGIGFQSFGTEVTFWF